jgi:hypothetical protein
MNEERTGHGFPRRQTGEGSQALRPVRPAVTIVRVPQDLQGELKWQ